MPQVSFKSNTFILSQMFLFLSCFVLNFISRVILNTQTSVLSTGYIYVWADMHGKEAHPHNIYFVAFNNRAITFCLSLPVPPVDTCQHHHVELQEEMVGRLVLHHFNQSSGSFITVRRVQSLIRGKILSIKIQLSNTDDCHNSNLTILPLW